MADSSFAALELLETLRQLPTPVSVVTPLRLDATLYEPAPQRQPKQIGRTDLVKIPKALLDCWFSLLCYAA